MNLGDEHDYNMPNALFLADVLERSAQTHTQANAAAEMRRLHAEVERLTVNGIHTCHQECQRPLCRLTRQRDALLEALRKHVYLHDKDCVCEDCAAIKAAEEKT